MKKNNKITLFTIIAIIITIIALIITSGTYAKYTSSIDTESAYATVAKWSVKINGKDITTSEQAITFNLFEFIYDSNGEDEENDVVNAKIAPGTSGGFSFNIENTSEVNIKYSIEFKENNTSSIPIEYSVDGINYYNAAVLTNQLNNNATNIAIGTNKNITVRWRWAYESASDDTSIKNAVDIADTNLGKASIAPTYEVSAKIIATQVD